MILKHYANLSHGQTHYRRAGEGVAIVMLHASPMSSAFMLPLINEFMGVGDIIAPDTPGYGQSDPLSAAELQAHEDLQPYVEWLREFINHLGLDKICLYGTATGAQIGIEFARSYPERVAMLVLDNAAHFTDTERTHILQHYFPSIAARKDGSHLQDVWNMVQGLFTWFPWFDQQESSRIASGDVPASFLHATVMAYLTAGENYAEAYRRAFLNEDASRVKAIEVPVRVIRWQGSILKKYSDNYDNFTWPDNIEMRHCDKDVQARYTAISQAIQELL